MEEPAITINEHFADLEDPRVDRTKLHQLLDIMIIAICAVICGADTWVAVEEFGNAKIDWFRTFLELPNGIPSHDTFGRVFALLDPEQFQHCFPSWVQAISHITDGEIVALDGKTLRRSHDGTLGKAAIHMVSAWASANRLVLGQLKVDEKSNEIAAVPEPDPDEPGEGGYGLLIIKELMDEVGYHCDPVQGNRLHLVKYFGGEDHV